jgi:hypothetical protein
MSTEDRCEEIRELLPELALGIAEGDERAGALAHLAECPRCARRLAELSETADSLLLLAPSEEPAAGFETSVLAGFQPRRVRRWRRGWAPPRIAAAGLAGAAIAATAVLTLAYRDDRDLAGRYRETLQEAGGRYLDAQRLADPRGEEVGTVFGYDGATSWILVTVDASAPMSAGRYEVEAVTTGGGRLELGRMEVDSAGGSLGTAIPIGFERVAGVRLLGPGRDETYDADFWERDG